MNDGSVIINDNGQDISVVGTEDHLAPGVSINERENVLKQNHEQEVRGMNGDPDVDSVFILQCEKMLGKFGRRKRRTECCGVCCL